MSGMKTALGCSLFLLLAFVSTAPQAAAQNGNIEFVAHVTPSSGIEEPVRGFPFFLLSRSYEQISREASAAFPKPDMDAFIDKLTVGPELKAWMKKNHCVTLSGEDFIHLLKTPAVMDTPEFFTAYLARNADTGTVGFPKPKYKPTDKTKEPAKYDKLYAEYREAIRNYMDMNPDSIDGIDIDLQDLNPGPKWNVEEAKRLPQIHQMVLQLSQSKYLVAQTQTNLQGEGFFHGVAPGNYWLTSLDVTANVGDARSRWDTPVTVRTGDTAYMALSNVNAVQPEPSSASNP
jgi:hypothetical protein